jgi:uncharacterized membrane protein YqjE
MARPTEQTESTNIDADSDLIDSEGNSMGNSKAKTNTSSKPGNESRLGAFSRETRGLVSDIKEWIELRVQLFQYEIEERIENATQKLISIAAVVIFALFALLFVLIGIAEAIGLWLENAAYGYLIVGLLMTVLTFIVNLSRPRFSKRDVFGDSESVEPLKRLEQRTEKDDNSTANDSLLNSEL